MLAGGLPGLARRFAALDGGVAGFDVGLTRFARVVGLSMLRGDRVIIR